MSINLTYSFDSEADLLTHLTKHGAPASTSQPAAAPLDPADYGVDSEGMPYDPEVHTESGAVKADGTWKARKSCGDLEKIRRAEWKARGGNITPPDITNITAAATPQANMLEMPGVTPSARVPEIPGLTSSAPVAPVESIAMLGVTPAAQETREPVSLETLVAKINDAFSRDILNAEQLTELYKQAGSVDMADYKANGELRATLLDLISALDTDE